MKISVVIITFNRKDDLRNTINSYQSQTYHDKEIIVIDNASQDGTWEMLNEEFPELKKFHLPDNIDIKALNIGIQMAEGEIIWRTDDDSYPENKETFENIADIFKKHNGIDIIATENIDVRRNYKSYDWYPFKIDRGNVPETGFKSYTFQGTGAGIRKKVFDKVGGFWEFGFEELEFCTRAILSGFNVRYYPNIRTLHFAAPGGRLNTTRWISYLKQLLRYQWKYFPWPMALGRTFTIVLMQYFIAIAQKIKFMGMVEGLFSMVEVILRTIRTERRVIQKEKIKDVTLGVNFTRQQLIYIKALFKSKFSKRVEN